MDGGDIVQKKEIYILKFDNECRDTMTRKDVWSYPVTSAQIM